jgi:hypothetical protein
MNVAVVQHLDQIAAGERLDEGTDLVGLEPGLAAALDDVDGRWRAAVLGDPAKETALVVVVGHGVHRTIGRVSGSTRGQPGTLRRHLNVGGGRAELGRRSVRDGIGGRTKEQE